MDKFRNDIIALLWYKKLMKATCRHTRLCRKDKTEMSHALLHVVEWQSLKRICIHWRSRDTKIRNTMMTVASMTSSSRFVLKILAMNVQFGLELRSDTEIRFRFLDISRTRPRYVIATKVLILLSDKNPRTRKQNIHRSSNKTYDQTWDARDNVNLTIVKGRHGQIIRKRSFQFTLVSSQSARDLFLSWGWRFLDSRHASARRLDFWYTCYWRQVRLIHRSRFRLTEQNSTSSFVIL